MPKRGWPHVDDPVAVGTRLKEARLAAGLSQRELSFPGCTAVYICRIEHGDRVPSLQVLRELARRVGVDENYLATGSVGAADDRALEADVALRLGEVELAEALYTELLGGDLGPELRGRALGGLGQIDLREGEVDAALERLEEALRLLGDALVEHLPVLDALARARLLRGERKSAVALVEQALELASARGDGRAETRMRVLLADVLTEAGELSGVRRLLEESVAAATDLADPLVRARDYWSRSQAHTDAQQPAAATRYAGMALAAIDVAESAEIAGRAHLLLARAELDRGNPEEALGLLERGRALAAGAGRGDGRFKVERARALSMRGRDDEAIALATEAAGELSGSRPADAGRAHAVAADVFARRGQRGRALALYERAGELLGDANPELLRELFGKTAVLLEAEGRKDEALELLKRAVALQGGARPSA